MINFIMPVYNTDFSEFKKAAYSVLTQTKKVLLTIIDDCSTEQNSNYYKQFCQNNGILYLRLNENCGPGKARQYGIDNGYTNTEWIAFIDSDDTILPQFAEIGTRELITTKSDLFISQIIHCGDSYLNDTIITTQNCGTWLHGKIYSRKFLNKYNIKFNDLRCNEDVYFNNCVYRCNPKIALIEQSFYMWKNYKDSITRKVSSKDFFRTNNIDFLKANIYSLEFAIELHNNSNLASIIGNIYNSYEYEKNINTDLSGIIDYIKKNINNYNIFEQLENEDFYNNLIKSTQTGQENYIFKESLYDFLKFLQELINE